MNIKIDAPNGMGWIQIQGEKGHYKLETSFVPFGNISFIEELEKIVHVLKVEKTKQGTGLYEIRVEPENYPNAKDLTLAELIEETAIESGVFGSEV